MSSPLSESPTLTLNEAESVLRDLAAVFGNEGMQSAGDDRAVLPNLEAMYRTLVEQIPAVVFMAYLDRGIGEAYVSPRIEEALGFTQAEWLEDPVRWYNRIHPDDQHRWSIEAAETFSTGKPLRSAYRVIARDGRVIWFHCEAKMIRRDDGRPWFIHGVGFDISDLKRAEQALEGERNLLSTVLDTVGALVVVLSPTGAILRFNRACEDISGYTFDEVRGKYFGDLFLVPEEAARFKSSLASLHAREPVTGSESDLITRDGGRRRISWSSTVLPGVGAAPTYVIATGIDITDRKRMEKAILEISAREQRKIGRDLHDGLGQHLTGIAFMSKVLERKLAADGSPEAVEVEKIVRLVNEAIHKTRELARGLLPVVSDSDGLMSALKRWTGEVEDLFRIPCRFECSEPVRITDVNVATHLYHIAQEAVNNAIKHARATELIVSLGRPKGVGMLEVEDNGIGLPDERQGHAGLGLHIMSYRANMIGGSLELRRGVHGGTVVSCRFPLRP
ncbi:MAG TPA: PAS domain S-box protein [Gemmatimonadales bacterium]|nr:PAS domain S-box protein [Gemmatimonadales bacterium]